MATTWSAQDARLFVATEKQVLEFLAKNNLSAYDRSEYVEKALGPRKYRQYIDWAVQRDNDDMREELNNKPTSAQLADMIKMADYRDQDSVENLSLLFSDPLCQSVVLGEHNNFVYELLPATFLLEAQLEALGRDQQDLDGSGEVDNTICMGIEPGIQDRRANISSDSATSTDSGYASERVDARWLHTYFELGVLACSKKEVYVSGSLRRIETDFVVVVSTKDRSVWLIYNFYPRDESGYIIPADKYDRPLFKRIPSQPETFTVGRIADNISNMRLNDAAIKLPFHLVHHQSFDITYARCTEDGTFEKIFWPEHRADPGVSLADLSLER
ncbi:MAG: hypothetical protein M1836_001080 [Candelina mexicana]|nr:MAG: hypothetical protein M1836_001080 [Candelina mexicana]